MFAKVLSWLGALVITGATVLVTAEPAHAHPSGGYHQQVAAVRGYHHGGTMAATTAGTDTTAATTAGTTAGTDTTAATTAGTTAGTATTVPTMAAIATPTVPTTATTPTTTSGADPGTDNGTYGRSS